MPQWLELDGARAELAEVRIVAEDGADRPGRADVAHVGRPALARIGEIRHAFPGATVVLDLAGEGEARLGRAQARRARHADAVLAGSQWELAELRRRLPGDSLRAAVVTRPVDLDRYAPAALIDEAKGRGRDLRRFRRFHRLAGPVVLFAGPYTAAGGLDAVVDCVLQLREQLPDVRLAAIPQGSVDEKYRDRCEMRALALGHHGIVEWAPAPAEVPFWYATAAVVCCLGAEPGSPEPAKRAAAAARPFVGADAEPFREQVEGGVTGLLVPPATRDALRETLEGLLSDEERSNRLGEAARRRSEEAFSPSATARSLRAAWEELAGIASI